MALSFVTIHSNSGFPSLLKDPGCITLYMSHMGYNVRYATLVQYDVIYGKEELRQFRESVPIDILEDNRKDKSKVTIFSTSILRYIWNNAKKIEILNLYYLKHSIFYGILYKMLNPKGFLYLKLDFDYLDMKKREHQWIEPFRRWCFSKYLKYIPNLVSAESCSSLEYVRKCYMPHTDKLIYIPDGIDNQLLEQNNIEIHSYKNKKNKILVVGRIGAYQKNHELILESLTYINNWDNWEIDFVGPIDKNFEGTIEKFYQENPSLKLYVHFVGPIYDRKKLLPFYDEAKVFCMSSRWESFGLVYAEAQYFGDYIISTPVSSTEDFIENDRDLGLIVHDAKEMGDALQDIINGHIQLEDSYEKRLKHGEKFKWSVICNQLDKEIRQRKSQYIEES